MMYEGVDGVLLKAQNLTFLLSVEKSRNCWLELL